MELDESILATTASAWGVMMPRERMSDSVSGLDLGGKWYFTKPVLANHSREVDSKFKTLSVLCFAILKICEDSFFLLFSFFFLDTSTVSFPLLPLLESPVWLFQFFLQSHLRSFYIFSQWGEFQMNQVGGNGCKHRLPWQVRKEKE